MTGAGRRAGLVTVDQALSSGSNILLMIYAAHALEPIDFGRFSIILLLAMFAQGLVRSLVSLPVLVHPDDADTRPQAVIGTAGLLGLVGAGLCFLIALPLWLAGSALALPTAALAACLPLLQVQDLGRYLAIARHTPLLAIVLDGLWLVLMIVAFALIAWRGDPSVTWLMLGWGATGGVAGLWVLVQYGVPGGRDVGLDWLRERWSFSWRTLVGNISANGGALIAGALISMVSTPVAVAAVRASLLLGRPGAAVQLAVGASTAADVAREQPDDRGLVRHQMRAMSLSGLAALGNVVILLALPDVVGRLLLGGVWPVIEPLLLATGLSVVAMALQSGVRAALLGRREVQTAMVYDIVGTVLTVVGLVVGAALGDASGAVWGTVVAYTLTSAAWWVAFGRYLRRRRTAAAAD